MGASAPGVMKNASRIFVTQEDVAILLGCGKSKAYNIVREVNRSAKKKATIHFRPARQINICFQIFTAFLLRKWTK